MSTNERDSVPADWREFVADLARTAGQMVNGNRLPAQAQALLAAAPEPQQGDELHPATRDLVTRFAAAMADKLLAAQRKYGYSDGWADPGWMDECRAHLLQHVDKGDPLDVANYCAFLWHHGASTAGADTPRSGDAPVAYQRRRLGYDGMSWEVCDKDFKANECWEVRALYAEPPVRPAIAESPPVAWQWRPLPYEWEADGKWRTAKKADYDHAVRTGRFPGQSRDCEVRELYTAPPADARDAKDARRYRWLRRKVGIVEHRGFMGAADDAYGTFTLLNMPYPPVESPDPAAALDAEIDRAMGATGGGQ